MKKSGKKSSKNASRGKHSIEQVRGAQGNRPAAEAGAPVAAAVAGEGLPRTRQIRAELDRERHRNRFFGTFRSTVFVLVVVAAIAVLVAVLLLPVLRIYGQSMESTLNAGDVVVSVKTSDLETGDIVAFYYNNNVLVKRVIAKSGDWVDIDKSGNVSVNGTQIEEPYLSTKAYGATDIALPYQVPEGKIFVMGDNRAVSIDSRSTSVGCIASEQLVGKIVFCVWPLEHFGPTN